MPLYTLNTVPGLDIVQRVYLLFGLPPPLCLCLWRRLCCRQPVSPTKSLSRNTNTLATPPPAPHNTLIVDLVLLSSFLTIRYYLFKQNISFISPDNINLSVPVYTHDQSFGFLIIPTLSSLPLFSITSTSICCVSLANSLLSPSPAHTLARSLTHSEKERILWAAEAEEAHRKRGRRRQRTEQKRAARRRHQLTFGRIKYSFARQARRRHFTEPAAVAEEERERGSKATVVLQGKRRLDRRSRRQFGELADNTEFGSKLACRLARSATIGQSEQLTRTSRRTPLVAL